MRVTAYHPLVSDLMFVLPAVVFIATGRDVPVAQRVLWLAAAVGAMGLIDGFGIALDLRVWPTTPVGPVRLYAGIAYESLSWSVSPVVVALFVLRYPEAFKRASNVAPAASRSGRLRDPGLKGPSRRS